MKLSEYLADDDPSKWYRLSSGEMENLFDEAMLSVDVLQNALEIICGRQQCADMTLSDRQIAQIALAKARGEA